jgi:hypothetical protein
VLELLPCRVTKAKEEQVMAETVSNNLRQEARVLRERHKSDMVGSKSKR